MRCPYCYSGKVKDMPNHLVQNKLGCGTKHKESLKQQLSHVIQIEQNKLNKKSNAQEK